MLFAVPHLKLAENAALGSIKKGTARAVVHVAHELLGGAAIAEREVATNRGPRQRTFPIFSVGITHVDIGVRTVYIFVEGLRILLVDDLRAVYRHSKASSGGSCECELV
jgi:hypothetical protein